MLAILGTTIEEIEKIIIDNKDNAQIYIANDNSDGQIVVSGQSDDLIKFSNILKSSKIKNIKLPVSAPFHCLLMNRATEIMKEEIEKIKFIDGRNILISNVSAGEIKDKENLKKLLIDQIESRVRWRESIIYMIDKGTKEFIEIGPGKVLSGLIKRINKDIKINTINNETDIRNLKI